MMVVVVLIHSRMKMTWSCCVDWRMGMALGMDELKEASVRRLHAWDHLRRSLSNSLC